MHDLSIDTGYFPSLLFFLRKRSDKQLDLYSKVLSHKIRAPNYDKTEEEWLAKVSISYSFHASLQLGTLLIFACLQVFTYANAVELIC